MFGEAFPSLTDVPIVGQWSGTVGMTLDRLPVVGELADLPGAIFAGAWNGHGVAMATASGALVAHLVLAGPSSSSGAGRSWPWARNRAPLLPPDPLRALGLSAYLTGLELLDRFDATLDRIAGRDVSISAARALSSGTASEG
ncbi:MAG: FAD-dependent oxidoreductase [Acidimicrobiales bacterium]